MAGIVWVTHQTLRIMQVVRRVRDSQKTVALWLRALMAIVLSLCAGIAVLPLDLKMMIPPALAVALCWCGSVVLFIGTTITYQPDLPALRVGWRGASVLSLLAGGALLGASNAPIDRASLIATLLLSTSSGLISLMIWGNLPIRPTATGEIPEARRFLVYLWYFLYGCFIIATILIPLLWPSMLNSLIQFMILRLIPISLAFGVTASLMERSRSATPLSALGTTSSWLGLTAQGCLLLEPAPFTLAWTLALLLFIAQMVACSRWVFSQHDIMLRNIRAELNHVYARLEAEREQSTAHEMALLLQKQHYHEWLAQGAHDVKLPLVPMRLGIGQLMLLAQRGNADAFPPLLAAMQSAFRRFDRFLSLFVDGAAQQLDGVFQLQLAPVQVVSLVQHVVDDEQQMLPDRYHLEFDHPPDSEGYPPDKELLAIWDRARIEAVILNLIRNAVRYSPETTPISIYCWQPKQGERVCFTVIDHGYGMSEETLTHLFEPYYRAPIAHRIDGQGLGLAITKAVVDAHQGQITVVSALNESTRIDVTLPLVVTKMPD
jgi:signal transduction histidine kinase